MDKPLINLTRKINNSTYPLAPIVLFTYNRPLHTKQTVQALQKNYLASESELYIYSDGPKDKNATEKVREVREYIKSIDGFKKVTIFERDKNLGLANNIISGVTKIVNEYGKIIVLEDDIVTSKYFLKFMNEALEIYMNEKKVWHISGWNYPLDKDGLGDIFLWRGMNCWGWATWSDRWCFYKKDLNKIFGEFSKNDIYRFNLDGIENFWNQIILNKKGKINSWAIFWYATIFKQNGLCLNASQTYAENIGYDGSGIHCGDVCSFVSNVSMNQHVDFNIKLEENAVAVERIKQFYKSQRKTFFVRAINKLSRIFFRYNLIK